MSIYQESQLIMKKQQRKGYCRKGSRHLCSSADSRALGIHIEADRQHSTPCLAARATQLLPLQPSPQPTHLSCTRKP